MLPPALLSIDHNRYFTKDNWNILDTTSIVCVLFAFSFRMVAYIKDLSINDAIFNNTVTQYVSKQFVYPPPPPPPKSAKPSK